MNGKRIRHVLKLRWTAELVITGNPLCLHHQYHRSHHKSHKSHCKWEQWSLQMSDTSSVSRRVTDGRTSDLNMKQHSTSPPCKTHSHWLLRVPSANTALTMPDEGKCVLMLNERTQRVWSGGLWWDQLEPVWWRYNPNSCYHINEDEFAFPSRNIITKDTVERWADVCLLMSRRIIEKGTNIIVTTAGKRKHH